MSDVRIDLRAYLAGNAQLSALVGTRVYVGYAEQDAPRPYLVLHMISGGHEHDLDGGAGFAVPRIQINCVADEPIAAGNLSDVLREQMAGFVGAWNGREIGVALLDDETDLPDTPQDGSDRPRSAIAHDYLVWHKESVTAPTA